MFEWIASPEAWIALGTLAALEIPLVFRGELYAVTCIFGGLVYTGLLSFGVEKMPSMFAGMLALLLLRLAAIRWHLTIPVFSRSGKIDP